MMDKEWLFFYDVHYVIFGIAFTLVACSCLYASIRARNTSILFAKSSLQYAAVNGIFIVFASSQALILLLYRTKKEEASLSALDFEQFLLNIGFPCLMTVYIRIGYHCLESLKGHYARFVFHFVVLQCYLFIIVDMLERTVPSGPNVIVNMDYWYNFISFFVVCALFSIIVYIKIFCRGSFDISDQVKNSKVLSVDIAEELYSETDGNDVTETEGESSENKESVVTFVVLCIGIGCVTIYVCILAGTRAMWDNNADMESWHSWMYANVLRFIELGNVVMMSYFTHGLTRKGNH